MKRPFAITSLLFILMAYVERFESRMDDDELYQCFVKLVCQMDKGEEFFNMVRDAGPQNAQKCIDIFRQVGDLEIPEFTLESVMQLKEIPCKWPEERRKKTFFDWSKLYGEYLLDVCQQADSELCIKADIAADQCASALAKYKATGDCPISKAVPVGMVKMGSSSFG